MCTPTACCNKLVNLVECRHRPSYVAGFGIDGWRLQRSYGVDTSVPMATEPLLDVASSDTEDEDFADTWVVNNVRTLGDLLWTAGSPWRRTDLPQLAHALQQPKTHSTLDRWMAATHQAKPDVIDDDPATDVTAELAILTRLADDAMACLAITDTSHDTFMELVPIRAFPGLRKRASASSEERSPRSAKRHHGLVAAFPYLREHTADGDEESDVSDITHGEHDELDTLARIASHAGAD